MKAFLSHSSKDSEFVCQVASILKRHLEVFYYEEHQRATDDFMEIVDHEMKLCDIFVFFVGKSFDQAKYMKKEVSNISKRVPSKDLFVINVALDSFTKTEDFPKSFLDDLKGFGFVKATDPVSCAKGIIQYLNKEGKAKIVWKGADGLPYNPHLFSYEKDIIDFYACRKILGEALFDKAKNPKHEREYEHLRNKLYDGCPVDWPQVVDLLEKVEKEPFQPKKNLLNNIGTFRDRGANVTAAALRGLCTKEFGFDFFEAGPREWLAFPVRPNGHLNVGVLVSGGIAPGINAVIDGIVERHWLYAGNRQRRQLCVRGFLNGFRAFDDARPNFYSELFPDRGNIVAGAANPLVTAEHANEGGSMLGTSRLEVLMDPNQRMHELTRILDRLQDIDILYMIGGDGTMKAAHALWSVAQEQLKEPRGRRRPLSVVAIPKTMDNDILWMWQSFGFLSAVEKAREVLEHLHTEVKSNPRLCVVQLFGSDSGFVVSHAVLASAAGQCDLALIPEVPFSLVGIARYLKKRICDEGRHIPRALIALAETAIPVDAVWYLDAKKTFPKSLDHATQRLISRVGPIDLNDEERNAILAFDEKRRQGKRDEGQTSDVLRRAGLKIVMQGLEKLLPEIPVQLENDFFPEWSQLRVMANEPRHLLRAIPPSTSDIIMGQRLGILAVDNAMAGFTDFMIGQWLTEFVLVPLELVVLGRKRIPDSGIFWKSVLAKTGQPHDLVAPWPLIRDPYSINLASFRRDLQEHGNIQGALGA